MLRALQRVTEKLSARGVGQHGLILVLCRTAVWVAVAQSGPFQTTRTRVLIGVVGARVKAFGLLTTWVLLAIPSVANTLLGKVSARQQLLLANGFPCNFSPECCKHNHILPLYGLQTGHRQSWLFMDLISLGCCNIIYTLLKVWELNLLSSPWLAIFKEQGSRIHALWNGSASYSSCSKIFQDHFWVEYVPTNTLS